MLNFNKELGSNSIQLSSTGAAMSTHHVLHPAGEGQSQWPPPGSRISGLNCSCISNGKLDSIGPLVHFICHSFVIIKIFVALAFLRRYWAVFVNGNLLQFWVDLSISWHVKWKANLKFSAHRKHWNNFVEKQNVHINAATFLKRLPNLKGKFSALEGPSSKSIIEFSF